MADWVLKGSLKGPQGDPGETPDLSGYATTSALTQAVAAESSARSKADELLQADVDGKMAPDDVVAGENVSVSVGDDGKVTVSAESGLPEGGTTGQVLTKTADGEAWQEIPRKPYDLFTDDHLMLRWSGLNGDSNSYVNQLNIGKVYNQSVRIGSLGSGNGIDIQDDYVGGHSPTFIMGSKSVTSITDTISSTDTDRANELVTGKAVADYVDAHQPTAADPDELVAYVKNYGGGA